MQSPYDVRSFRKYMHGQNIFFQCAWRVELNFELNILLGPLVTQNCRQTRIAKSKVICGGLNRPTSCLRDGGKVGLSYNRDPWTLCLYASSEFVAPFLKIRRFGIVVSADDSKVRLAQS